MKRFALYTVCGSAFWLPSILIHSIRRSEFGAHPLDLATMTLLPMLAAISALAILCRRYRSQSRPRTIALWMLFGIWFLGPLCMTVGASFSGGGFSQPGGIPLRLLILGIPLFVPITFAMSAYDGSLGALAIATILFPCANKLVWRFSVRTLLIATTLIAVVLGVVVAAR